MMLVGMSVQGQSLSPVSNWGHTQAALAPVTPETMKAKHGAAKQHQQVAAGGGEIGLDNVSTTCMCQAVGNVTSKSMLHTHIHFFYRLLILHTVLLLCFILFAKYRSQLIF